MSFTAKYRGACADCEEGITPGDEVAYRGDGEERELAHVNCPTPKAPLGKPCTVCFLIHPEGACDQ